MKKRRIAAPCGKRRARPALARRYGFRGIERVAAMLIVAAVALLAAPSIGQWVLGQRVKGVSYDLFETLTFARAEALKRGIDVVVAPTGSDWHDGWQVTASGAVLHSQAVSPRIRVSGPREILFRRDGRPAAAVEPLAVSASGMPALASYCVGVHWSGRPSSGECPASR